MKNTKLLFAVAALLFCLHTSAQAPEFKIFLIGDAGDEETTGQTLDSLGSQLQRNPNSAVVFLGDNSYSHAFFGLAHTGWRGFDSTGVTERRVKSQLGILNNYKGSVYFVPGNHDWWNRINIKRGKPKLKLEENFITKNLVQNPNIKNPEKTYLPQNGEPGPSAVELNNGKVKLICIDSYWLIIAGFKNNQSATIAATEKQFYHNLDSIMADASAKHQLVIVASHHPVYGDGLNKTHKHFFFPKRIEQQFMSFYAYHRMIGQMLPILKKYPGTYYATGHLHAMQYHYADNVHYIISGAGSKIHHKSQKALAAIKARTSTDWDLYNEKGFFELDLYPTSKKIIIHYDEGKKRQEL